MGTAGLGKFLGVGFGSGNGLGKSLECGAWRMQCSCGGRGLVAGGRMGTRGGSESQEVGSG